MDPIGEIEYIIVHHTERNNDFPALVKFRHINLRGWEDVGYHYLIGNRRPFTTDGQLYVGRSAEFEGAHTLGLNKNSLGICLIGNCDKTLPSKKQFATLIELIEHKIKQHGVPIENVRGHNEFPNVDKSCPGRLVSMDYIRAVLAKQSNCSVANYAAILDHVALSDSISVM